MKIFWSRRWMLFCEGPADSLRGFHGDVFTTQMFSREGAPACFYFHLWEMMGNQNPDVLPFALGLCFEACPCSVRGLINSIISFQHVFSHSS